MNYSIYGTISGVLSVIWLLLLVGLLIFAMVKTRGRTRTLVGAGMGLILANRLLSLLAPLLYRSFEPGDMTLYLIMSIFFSLLEIGGIGVLVWAVVTALTEAGPANPWQPVSHPQSNMPPTPGNAGPYQPQPPRQGQPPQQGWGPQA